MGDGSVGSVEPQTSHASSSSSSSEDEALPVPRGALVSPASLTLRGLLPPSSLPLRGLMEPVTLEESSGSGAASSCRPASMAAVAAAAEARDGRLGDELGTDKAPSLPISAVHVGISFEGFCDGNSNNLLWTTVFNDNQKVFLSLLS
jgi:hypothetical protein